LAGGATRYLFRAGAITEADGKTRHPWVVVAIDRDGKGRLSLYQIVVHVRGKYEVIAVGRVALAGSPKAAPGLYLGGPLTFTPLTTVLDRTKETDLRVYITGRAGESLVTHVLCESVGKDVHPVAEIEFPNKFRDAKPLRRKVVLDRRC
jgi:hypothetical protein